MEFQESYYSFQIPQIEMEPFVPQQDLFALKMEDNSDHYLFNYLLNAPNHLEDHFFEGLLDHQHHPKQESLNSRFSSEAHIIQEISSYICIRTTPLRQILEYIGQYYPMQRTKQKTFILALRKYKLKIKRQHAKMKSSSLEVNEPEVQKIKEQQDIKIEDSQMSQVFFDDQSQETKKKKRNRMSAQNSRDRKKQYIKAMQTENQELKRQIKALSSPKQIQTASKQFFTTLLCMGITCFVNNNGYENNERINIIDQYTSDEKTPISSLNEEIIKNKSSSVTLQYYQRLLPVQNQAMIEEVLISLGEDSQIALEKRAVREQALAKLKCLKSKRTRIL